MSRRRSRRGRSPLLRPPRLPMLLLALLLCGGSPLAGCAGAQATDDTLSEAGFPEDLRTHFSGRWAVHNASEDEIASMLFLGERVTALSEGSWFRGHWEARDEEGMLTLEIRFSEASDQGVRMVLGMERRVALRLVSLSPSRVLALQENGQWAIWTRRAEEAP